MKNSDLEKLEKELRDNKDLINKSLNECSEHVPKEDSRYFDGSKAIEICSKCSVTYETEPTQKEISDWNYLVREKFY